MFGNANPRLRTRLLLWRHYHGQAVGARPGPKVVIGGSYREQLRAGQLYVVTVFKGVVRVFVEAHQSPFCIQIGGRDVDSVQQNPPESAGVAVKLAVN